MTVTHIEAFRDDPLSESSSSAAYPAKCSATPLDGRIECQAAGTTTHPYDSGGNLATARGVVAAYVYVALIRVTSVIYNYFRLRSG
jgi:hypothetical protein